MLAVMGLGILFTPRQGEALPSIEAHEQSQTVRLAWDPNTEPTLAGYVLVYGPSSGVYTDAVTIPKDAQTWELSLPQGTYFFAIRAFDIYDVHSGYSNEVRVDLGNEPVTARIPPAISGVVVVVIVTFPPS
ncbi:MAG: hypothetical protein E6R03_16060 [Hyphomicrobiaceae bacterium]|nr:MAG: hypothetical protein E6R03_16060 [Hyphomicrobiaceae bacterium]